MKISSILLFIFLLSTSACLDRLNFDSDIKELGDFIIEGYISDQPGPYTIKLFKPVSPDANLLTREPFVAKEIILSDDHGNSEKLAHAGSGVYVTSKAGIQGIVGRKYSLRIELLDGGIFESEPDELKPVGEVTNLYHEFERYKPLTGPTEYRFRIYMDAQNNSGFVRWRFTGTYVVLTFPGYKLFPVGCKGEPNPPECSGVIWTGTAYQRIGDCTCCNCWVNDHEPKPNLSSDKIVTNGRYEREEVGYIPFDVWRFHFRKYMVKVEQMSLTDAAYEYWSNIKDQKEASSSLFQPPFGKLGTNFHSHNSSRKVEGFFYATAIKQRILFISANDAEIPVPDFDIPPEEACDHFWEECDVAWLNASRTPPPEWEQ